MKRDAVLQKARKKNIKTTDFLRSAPTAPVFINEHLTAKNKNILYEAKKVKKERGFKYVWVRNAKIFVRKNDNTIAMHIRSLSDLDKLK